MIGLYVYGIHANSEEMHSLPRDDVSPLYIKQGDSAELVHQRMTIGDHTFVIFDGHGPERGASSPGLALHYESDGTRRTMKYLGTEDVVPSAWCGKIFMSTA